MLSFDSSPYEFYNFWKDQKDDPNFEEHKLILFSKKDILSVNQDNDNSYTFAELLRKNEDYDNDSDNLCETKYVKDVYDAPNLITASMIMLFDLQESYDMDLCVLNTFCQVFKDNCFDENTPWKKMILSLTRFIVEKYKIVEIFMN